MNILDGTLRKATQEHLNAPWSGNKRNFRCGFCGHTFMLNDLWLFLFTNDMPDAPGNPFVCEACYKLFDEDKEKLRAEWKRKWKAQKNDEWWWFHRHEYSTR